MARIFQNNRGEISNFIDRSIEQIICLDGIDRYSTFTDIFLIRSKLITDISLSAPLRLSVRHSKIEKLIETIAICQC